MSLINPKLKSFVHLYCRAPGYRYGLSLMLKFLLHFISKLFRFGLFQQIQVPRKPCRTSRVLCSSTSRHPQSSVGVWSPSSLNPLFLRGELGDTGRMLIASDLVRYISSSFSNSTQGDQLCFPLLLVMSKRLCTRHLHLKKRGL